jgi:hypothetical protein
MTADMTRERSIIMPRTYLPIRLRDQDQPQADEVLRLLAVYKAEHGKRTLFEALAELLLTQNETQ